MDDDAVSEADCVICSGSAEQRREHFSTDYVEMPLAGVCERCQLAFCQAITGQEEVEPPEQPTKH
jgi:hypothetical protein